MNDSQYAVLIDLAKLAEQTERYEDMADYMKKAIEKEHGEPQLTSEDRNLLSVAYKNVIGAKRFSWRAISGIEEKETDDRKRELEKGYIKKIEDELKQTCDEVLVRRFCTLQTDFICICWCVYVMIMLRWSQNVVIATLAWKESGFNRNWTHDRRVARRDALQTEIWSHRSCELVNLWVIIRPWKNWTMNMYRCNDS